MCSNPILLARFFMRLAVNIGYSSGYPPELQVQRDLKICMGDHMHVFNRSVPYWNWITWNFSSNEPIKTMLDAESSIEPLYRMHLRVADIVSLAQKAIVGFNETTLNNALQQIIPGFSEINFLLKEIWHLSPNSSGMLPGFAAFDNYGSKRQSLRSLIDKWTTWSYNCSNPDAYSALQRKSSCLANDMNDWFLGVKVMMNQRYENGSNFARAQLGETRHRGYFSLQVSKLDRPKYSIWGTPSYLGVKTASQ